MRHGAWNWNNWDESLELTPWSNDIGLKKEKNSHFPPFHFFDPPMDLKQPREMTKQPDQKHLYSFETISTN